MTDAVRAPGQILEGLPEFPFPPHYRDWDGLRLAHIDVGEGPPVVMWHGQPTWSFLWRKVLSPIVAAGYRVICPDLPGFGRSDKPTDLGWYSADRHVAAGAALLDHLDLVGATFVIHDWGGPIGLRLAVEHRDRVDRLVTMDTGVTTGEQRMSEAWRAYRDFVAGAEDLEIGSIVRAGCATDPGDEVAAAYDAPFPSPVSKAGARAFPLMYPLTPDSPGAEAGRRTLAALREDERPMLMLWAESDPVLPLKAGEAFAASLGRSAPRMIEGAGHFLQEDRGQEIGRLIADWLAG
jgi:haloalkane dehalogenase